MASNFRTLYQRLVPRWLNDGADGSRVLHTFAWMIDASLERVYRGLLQRLPSYAGPSASRLLGRDRQIPRGKRESSEAYAARLIGWRGEWGHRNRGGAPALLRQLWAYFGSTCWTIDRSGNRDNMSATGEWSYSMGETWTWDARPLANDWARFWIIVTPIPEFDWYDKQAIWLLLNSDHPWRPLGTQPEWLIFAPDGATPTPDATWAHWSELVDGTQIPARDTTLRYLSLDPAYNNTYAGDPSNFCESSRLVGGAYYAGDPAKFPGVSTAPDESPVYLPNDTAVTGDPTEFAASVVLIDDGDLQWP